MVQGSASMALLDLIRVLAVPYLHATSDMAVILKLSSAFDSSAKAHAAALLQTEQYRRWLAADSSELIHVDGYLDPSLLGKTSPISYISAAMVQILQDVHANITLSFFCGQHLASNDVLKESGGLIRALLSQLTLAILQKWPRHRKRHWAPSSNS